MYIFAIFIYLLGTQCYVKGESHRDLKDKVVIVTGAARGIGLGITVNFLKEKVKAVIIVDKNLTQGLVTERKLKCKYGAEKAWFIHGDVTTDLEKVYKKISAKYNYVDILVNNAGIGNEDDPKLTLMTNVVAPAVWTQKFYNIMRKDKGGKGGIILNIASIESYTWAPIFRFYRTSKFGLLGLSVSFGHKWNYMSSRVKVFALCPSYTDTTLPNQQTGLGEESEYEIIKKYTQSLPLQTTDDVGKAAMTVCKTGTTGTAYTVEGGVLSISPDRKNITVEYLRSLQ